MQGGRERARERERERESELERERSVLRPTDDTRPRKHCSDLTAVKGFAILTAVKRFAIAGQTFRDLTGLAGAAPRWCTGLLRPGRPSR